MTLAQPPALWTVTRGAVSRRLGRAVALACLLAAGWVTHCPPQSAAQSIPGGTSQILPLPKPPAPPPRIYSTSGLPVTGPTLLSPRDRELFEQALRAASRRQWSSARQTAGRSSNPLIAQIIEWAYLRAAGPHVGFVERTAFLEDHPDWPARQEIQRYAEATIDGDVAPATLVRWFDANPPLTTDGKVAYARSLRLQGKITEAAAVARDVWRTGSFSRSDENSFLRDFNGILSAEDHRARVDYILYQEQTSAASRLLSRLDDGYAKVARARIALITSAGGVDNTIAAVPTELRNDAGLIFDRIRWRRARGNDDDARALIPEFPLNSPRPDMWWRQRNVLARDALSKGFVTEAYRIARYHGATDAFSVSEAEWLAGWIALRFLKDGEAALPHFEKVYDTVQMPISLSKGAYWTGRTAEFLGRPDIAKEWYERAAAYITTFYGQLAFSRMKDGPAAQIPEDPEPTPADRDAFEKRQLTHALRVLLEVDAKSYQRAFALALADSSGLAADRHMVAELVNRYGRPDLGVWIARQSARDKFVLLEYGYPLPAFGFQAAPEQAFVLGIARQESNFDPAAMSPVGARGLMQLMPATARAVARSKRLRYDRNRLTSDPTYNIQLGSAYLDSMVRTFDGSYIMAAAAYNAGPSRPRAWARQFGDPRDASVDPIDWIEQIPFSETRSYVQRIMENVMIYRARLNGTNRLGSDLEAELGRRHE